MRWLRCLFDPSLPGWKRLLRAVLLCLLLVACICRVWLILSFNPMDHIWSDPARHWFFGTHPLDTSPLSAIDPIGYHLYIGFLAKVTAQSHLLVAFWTALLSLSAPWVWYRFLRELLPSKDWALVGWVVFAALPSWSALYSYFMQETLMLPLLGGALWATWRCRRKRNIGSFLLAIGVWTLAGMTRGICIPLAAVAMTWLWFEQGDKIRKAAFSMAILLAVLGPLAGRSWSIARLVSPHGIGTMVQLYHLAGTESIMIDFTRRSGSERWNYVFTSPALLRPPFEPMSRWQTRREGVVHLKIDLDAGSRDWEAAKQQVPPMDFSRFVWLTSDNLIHLFFSASWPDTDLERAIGRINFWLRWIWAPLALACLIATVVRWRRDRERLLAVLLVVWFVVQGLFPLAVNEGRYRKPFEGLLIAQCLLLASGARRNRGRVAKIVAAPKPLVPPSRLDGDDHTL